MSADRWDTQQRIFREARELPAGDRAAFVKEACGDDLDLLREVQSLIDHAEAASSEAIVGQIGSGTPPTARVPKSATDPMIGRKIGAFSIKSVIASGGMGTVYVAVQESPVR